MKDKGNAKKLTEIEVTAIAFTEAPANRRRFLVIKNDAKGGDKSMKEKEEKSQGTVSAEALQTLLSSLESVMTQLKTVLEADEDTTVDDETVDGKIVESDDVEKKGAVFSTANKKLIQSVIDMLTKALKSVEAKDKGKTSKTDETDTSHDHEAHDDDEDADVKSAIVELEKQTQTLVTEAKFKEMIDKVRKEMLTSDKED